MRRILSFACLFSLVSLSFCQSAATPKAGSELRKQILDSVRVPIQRSLHGQKVVFVITHLRVLSDWAFVFGAPKGINGKPIDYKNSDYKEIVDSGVFDENFGALLRKRSGKWVVTTWFFGATDVPWVDWHDKYKAPKALFPPYG